MPHLLSVRVPFALLADIGQFLYNCIVSVQPYSFYTVCATPVYITGDTMDKPSLAERVPAFSHEQLEWMREMAASLNDISALDRKFTGADQDDMIVREIGKQDGFAVLLASDALRDRWNRLSRRKRMYWLSGVIATIQLVYGMATGRRDE